MHRKRNDLSPLGDVISGLFQKGGLPFNPDDGRIWEIWKDAVGDAVAGQARPAWIKQGLLRVEVSTPVWLQELRYLGEDIRERVNRKMGREAVQRIEFRMGTCGDR